MFVVSDHQKKYDRQMRLWGGHGQQLLEEAQICVIGGNCLASETLKNCVLPNIGSFILVDDVKVSVTDLGNNFFITVDDIGKYRAEVVTKWLLEMNPDANGIASVISARNMIIANDFSFLQKTINDAKAGEYVNVVIATQMFGNECHKKLAEFCWSKGIAYLNLKVNGLLGYLRVQIQELCIIESHPTNDTTDMFLNPKQLTHFPALQEYIQSFDINTKDVEAHAHLPCVAILGQFSERYTQRTGSMPSNFREQQEFKDEISEMGNGENYMDAVHWASQCYLDPRISREVRLVLNDSSAELQNITPETNQFWILVRALLDFMANEGNGFLPVSTNIPDITADTKSYVRLKQIYQLRYEQHLAIIGSYVEKHCTNVFNHKSHISSEIIERFVRNCRNLKVVRCKSVADEYSSPDLECINECYFDISAMLIESEEEEAKEESTFQPMMINWYWTFRLMDDFYDHEKRICGSDKSKMETDVLQLINLATKLFSSISLDQTMEEHCLSEIVRFGGCEMHNTAAFMGGVAAQVTMKIILQQFFPFNHTLVYNGIHCSLKVFSF